MAENIDAGYGDAIIVQGVSIQVAESEIVAIVGPNGSGKSTLIKSFLGFARLFQGKVFYQGKDITGIASALAPLFSTVIVTSSRHPRAVIPAVIAADFSRYGVEVQVQDNVPAALSQALALAGDKDLICVAGSLFTVAEAIEQADRLCLK